MAQAGSKDEKNWRSKISLDWPFNTSKKCFKNYVLRSQEPEPAPGKKFPKPEPPQNRTAPKPWFGVMILYSTVALLRENLKNVVN